MTNDNRTYWRRNNRLPPDVYKQPGTCSLTLVTENRLRAFTREPGIVHCVDLLRRESDTHLMSVLAYCFMPDHLHLLIQNSGKSSISDYMRDFKQATGYRYKQRTGHKLWQKGFHDHFVRSDEDLRGIAEYIFDNPVRAGLVRERTDYLFSGSFEWGRAALVQG